MAWIKTEAGKREMQTRSLVSARTQRNLLVLIDGRCSVQALCEKITGASEADFESLREAGMIEWMGLPAPLRTPASPALEPSTPTSEPSYSHLSATLTRLVSTELGLRGLPLTLAVERARSTDDLLRVAETVVARIRERRGDASAEAARTALFGS